ncbi:MAG TPA: prolyl oligopeptidase family serine peptidase [Fimbriimonadaceae bacterium]|nr:prolyl oligopeptidase family serine peptidase [Fimbriimonadaceae bacterium]
MLALIATVLLAPARTELALQVGSDRREAILHVPAASQPAPVFFVFHGHGGRAVNMERRNQYERLWPEAIVVYMQGLPAPGRNDPEGKRTGWQKNPGELGDRDLAFFDAVLAKLRKEQAIDPRRVFVTGHSNGGRMAYLLWAKRSDMIAAGTASGSTGRGLIAGTTPRSFLVIAGEKDETTPFESQKQSIAELRSLFGIDGAKPEKVGSLEIEKGRHGVELGTMIYPGGHQVPPQAAEAVVAFLKRQRMP